MDTEIKISGFDLSFTISSPILNSREEEVRSTGLVLDTKRPNFFVRKLPPLRTRWGLAQPRSHL